MSDPGRAVVLAHDLGARGGAERLALAAAATLRDLGYRTSLASTDAPGADAVRSSGAYLGVDTTHLDHLPLPPTPRWARRLPVQAALLIRDRRWMDLLETQDWSICVNTQYKSELPGLGRLSLLYVHFPHTLTPEPRGRAHAAYLRSARCARRRVVPAAAFPTSYDVTLANSAFTATHVTARWGATATVLHPPAALLPTGDAARIRSILAVGRFQDSGPQVPHKGQDAMIDAFRDLGDLHAAGWRLHLAGSVGSPDELRRLRDLARGLPVDFHPDLPAADLARLYATSSLFWHAQGHGQDVAVAPQAHEHFGIVAVEAMSAGLLPVVYAVGGPAEIVAETPGTATWRTIPELRARTRALAALSGADADTLRRQVVARARTFDASAFSKGLGEIVVRHRDR